MLFSWEKVPGGRLAGAGEPQEITGEPRKMPGERRKMPGEL
jgi:hypothetical protein